jgi:hypothetical protein
VNQFLRLEQALEMIESGASGNLELRGGRPLPLTMKVAEAYRKTGVPQVDVTESIVLRRDDDRLIAEVDRMIDEVRYGPVEQRERPLSLLLTLRAPIAVQRWQGLVGHRDPRVSERVRQGLQVAEEVGRRK